MRKQVATEEGRRMARLRNIKSTLAVPGKKKKKKRVERERELGQFNPNQFNSNQGGSKGERPAFQTSFGGGVQNGSSKNGIRARDLRDTDYIQTTKQKQKQQRLPRINNGVEQTDDDGMGYLDSVSLNNMGGNVVPTFPVGLTDNTLSPMEKRKIQRQIENQVKNGIPDTPVEDEGAGGGMGDALDMLDMSNYGLDSVDNGARKAVGTGKKKKKKRIAESKSAGMIRGNEPLRGKVRTWPVSERASAGLRTRKASVKNDLRRARRTREDHHIPTTFHHLTPPPLNTDPPSATPPPAAAATPSPSHPLLYRPAARHHHRKEALRRQLQPPLARQRAAPLGAARHAAERRQRR